MADLQTIGGVDNEKAVRKYTVARVFIAPEATELPTSITEADPPVLSALPAGWVSLGMVTKDGGFAFSNSTDTSTVDALGYSQPVRRDITSEEDSVQFTCLEDRRIVREVVHRVDLSAVSPDAITGEVFYAKPLQSVVRYYRMLIIGVDGTGPSEFFEGTLYPRAMLSESGDRAYSNDDAAGFPITLMATPDLEAGFASATFLGGTGQKDSNAARGYSA